MTPEDDLQKQKDRERPRALLLEGANSPIGGVADKAYFDELRERIGTAGKSTGEGETPERSDRAR